MNRMISFSKAHPSAAKVLPTAMYICTGLAILLASGPWSITAAGWQVYYGPVVWTIGMLAIAILLIKKAARLDLKPLHQQHEGTKSLALRIAGYFCIILIIRQLMIWQFYNPWEKLPIVFLVILQVMLVEGTRLTDFGLKDWNARNIGLAFIIAATEFVLTTTCIIIIYIITFGPDVIYHMYISWTSQLYWISFPYQFLAVGFAEELFFRGYIYTKLRVHFSRTRRDKESFVLAMAITNILFGFFHVPWYVGSDFSFDVIGCIQRVIVTGAMGVCFSYIYEKSGSLAAPMLVHGFSNSIQPLVAFFTPLIYPSDWSVAFFEWRFVLAGLVMLPVFILITRFYASHALTKREPTPWMLAQEESAGLDAARKG